jgi:hypothetical protein
MLGYQPVMPIHAANPLRVSERCRSARARVGTRFRDHRVIPGLLRCGAPGDVERLQRLGLVTVQQPGTAKINICGARRERIIFAGNG